MGSHHVDDYGREYWSARELMEPLGYSRWQRFGEAIDRAKASAQAQKMDVTSQFTDAGSLVDRPQGGTIEVADVHLTRYAAYLVAMNGDPSKPEIAP